MIKPESMLTIWRRHTAQCPHREKGRSHLKCNCPLWADGYINGQRTLRQSLGTADMARARKKAVALESPDAIVYKPLHEAIDAYLLNCQHLSDGVQRKLRNRLRKQLLPFCVRAGVESVRELGVEAGGVEILDNFRAQRRTASGHQLALTTSARELETYRQFFDFSVARKWIDENPAKRIKPPRNARPAPVVPYTPEEMDKIIKAASEFGRADYERLRARAAVLLLRYTALRISDVAMLERARVQTGELLIHTKKTGGTVRPPLPDELLAALDAVPIPRGADKETSTYFFINGTGSARTAVSVLERSLRAVFKESGVKDAHPHRFRHTLATEILANAGTLADVADVLAISESVAGKHYAKWNQARQDRITTLMSAIQSGTNRAHKKRLVVIR